MEFLPTYEIGNMGSYEEIPNLIPKDTGHSEEVYRCLHTGSNIGVKGEISQEM